jgi:hypothetical protein
MEAANLQLDGLIVRLLGGEWVLGQGTQWDTPCFQMVLDFDDTLLLR